MPMQQGGAPAPQIIGGDYTVWRRHQILNGDQKWEASTNTAMPGP